MSGSGSNPSARAYRCLRALTRAALALYYREVEVHGAETAPARGPLLVLANHNNGMIDPMLVVATSRREVRYVAKAPLFEIPVLGWIVRAAGAVPVYRPQDPGYDPGKNAGAYVAVAQALGEGGAIGIFPEGKSHTDPWVAEFKHGAARMALEAEAAHGFELGLSIQLVGIQFERSRLFRGRVLVHWAPPCTIASQRQAYERDPRAAVEALTASLHEALRAMVVEAEDAEMVRLADLVERFGVLQSGAGLKGRLERRQRLIAGYRRLRAQRPDEMAQILGLLRRYDDLLRGLGVRDDDVERAPLRTGAPWAALCRTAALVLGAPLAGLGLALNAVPYGVVLFGAVRPEATSDMRASTGLLAATAVFPAWYLLLVLAGWWSPLPWVFWLPAAAAGPALGLFTMRWRERWRAYARSTAFLWLALRSPSARARLWAMRREVLSRIEDLVRAEGAASGA